ncbi:MAG: delta-lactam-biosynthetic de-N-acetylase [Ruminococcaceae bacterium]|nr:delta-lactam-biosynthetic de-N-acetylase [Oscillospiraceae bacterium]
MRKISIYRKITGCLAFILLGIALTSNASAAGTVHNWYCVHEKDHVQPRAGQELLFVEKYDGYYIDHRHASQEDADKVIYLTFDAGYENGNVAKILDTLNEERIPAAFFILGNLIVKNTDLVRRMVEEGHTVCNHTVRHKDMSGADEAGFLKELQELEQLYREKLGVELSRYYRPPEGRFSQNNMENAKKNGYQTIFWSFAYPDWDNAKQMPDATAKKIITENFHNGEVMLLHPTSEVNARILKDVIQCAKDEGYRFGTLDELTGKTDARTAE